MAIWPYGFRGGVAGLNGLQYGSRSTSPNNEMKLTKGTATEMDHASRHFVPRRASLIKVPFAAYLGVMPTT
jgi:hypothetical protein